MGNRFSCGNPGAGPSPGRSRAAVPALFLLLLFATQAVWGQRPSQQPLRPAEREQKTPPRPPVPLPQTPPFQGEPQLLRTEPSDPADLTLDLDTPVDPDTYRLGPGDQLSVGVTARTPSTFVGVVSPLGTIFVPAVGDVAVGGLTLSEAQEAVMKALMRVRHAGTFSVSVRLTRLRRLKVQVLGEVQKPGVYRVGPMTRLIEAIAHAGGLTPIASRRHVQLRRRQGAAAAYATAPQQKARDLKEPSLSAVSSAFHLSLPSPGAERQASTFAPLPPMEIDLEQIVLHGDPTGNVLLEAEDVIFVPRAQQIVSVSGEVNRPGDYECDPGETVAELLERAGGARSQGALSAVQVERPEAGDRRRLFVVDLTADGGAFVLQNRDRILVPPITTVQGRLRVVGAVKGEGENWQPDMDASVPRTADLVSGVYLLRRGERVRDVVENLGGLTAKADGSRAKIERPNGSGGVQAIPVDLYRAVTLQDPDHNLELKDGDTLVVPKRQDRVYVLGDVGRQGEQEYIEGKTVLDYIGAAGGPGARAKRRETVILRATEDSSPRTIRVGLDRMLSGKTPADAIKVEPGDVIFIPSASIRGWQDVAQASFSLLSLFTTGLLLAR